MKRILYFFTALLLITGCDLSNTPTKQVEAFFNKYQTLDADVLSDLDRVIAENDKFNSDSRDKYREIIKKQYKNLVYKIKEEKIDGDNAVVTTEITVSDFAIVLSNAEQYKNSNKTTFLDDNGNYDDVKYTSYVIDQLKDAKEKVKYTIDMRLSKIDSKWVLNDLDSDTEDKILGIYQY